MSLERRIGYHVPDVAVILQQCGYVINTWLCRYTRGSYKCNTRFECYNSQGPDWNAMSGSAPGPCCGAMHTRPQ